MLVADINRSDTVTRYRQILQKYDTPQRQRWIRDAKDDEDFVNGAQLTAKEQKELTRRRMFPAVVNVLKDGVEQAVALLTANKPRFTSTGREDSDKKTGKIFADLMSHIWDVSDGDQELKGAIRDYYQRGGIGYLLAYYDSNADMGKGQVFFKNVDPFNVYVDPNTKNKLFKDSGRIAIKEVMSEEQILSAYPDFKEKLPFAKKTSEIDHPHTEYASTNYDSSPYLDDLHDHYEVLDIYEKMKFPFFHVLDESGKEEKVLNEAEFKAFSEEQCIRVMYNDGRVVNAVSDEDVAYWEGFMSQVGQEFHFVQGQDGQPQLVPGPEDAQSIPNSGGVILLGQKAVFIQEGVIVVNQILENRIKRVIIIGEVEYYNEIMPIRDYPIVPIVNNHARNPYPRSDIAQVRPLQKSINKFRSIIMAHASNSTSVKLLLPKGGTDKKAIEEAWSKVGTAVVEYDSELGVPVIAGPVPLPNELYHLEEKARNDIQEILGVYKLGSGDPSQAPDTYKGIVSLDEFGQRRIKARKDDIEMALNQLAKVCVQMIQYYYTEYKAYRILSPNNPPNELKINEPIYDDITGRLKYILNDVTVGEYDVICVSGSMLPSSRWAQLEYYMSLYKEGIIDQEEVLKKSEVVDTEGVLNRKSQMNQMMAQIQSQEEEIKKLQGDLQTSDREAVHLRKENEVIKWKAGLDKLGSEARAATTVFNDTMRNQEKSFKDKMQLEIKKQSLNSKNKQNKRNK